MSETAYTSKKLAFNNAEQFKEAFYEPEPTTIGYMFIGNHVPWTNEDAPDDISDTVSDEKTVWDNMFAAKKITGNDVELVVPRYNWTANTKYKQYDDVLPLEEMVSSNTSLNLGPIYVMNSERNVYICLSNNVSSNSTVEPTGKNLSANGNISTDDGYLWKYLYNVRASNKFLANNWIPVPTSTAKLDYDSSNVLVVDGELVQIVVTNPGSGYIHSTISVNSFATGCSVLTVANTQNIVANLAISGTGIAGGTYIQSVDTINNKLTLSTSTINSGGGTSHLNVKTRVYIFGNGLAAAADAELSGNTISKVVMTTYGKDYSVADIQFFGTGTGAAARAVLPPKKGHGFNAAKQFCASNVMVSIKIGEIDSTEGGLISTDTSFRQYGLLRDPYKYGDTVQVSTTTANLVISQTTDITLVSSGTQYQLQELVYQGTDTANSTFSGYVQYQEPTEVRLTKVSGSISIGAPLKGTQTNLAGRTVVALTPPEFQPYTGDILYIENIPKIQRIDGQAENLKFVIRF